MNYSNGICTMWSCGFFSCCSVKLGKLIQYAHCNKRFPDYVDGSRQFGFYKVEDPEIQIGPDITHRFFNTNIHAPEYNEHVIYTDQFTDYKKINYKATTPVIQAYFKPSNEVFDRIRLYETKYNIDYENTCGIFYRGNDKRNECTLAPYQEYEQRALEVQQQNSDVRFFIQTDDSIFLQYFLDRFNNCFDIKELPKINDPASAVTYKLAREDRVDHGIDLVAVVNILARCKNVIVHSGNCAYWSMLYRGKPDGIIQHFTNESRAKDRWI